ncbi:ROK family transcriptional regulator [Arenibaculum pallidiluteum]|uniref:ROK family transcriptional regulator n=1 Tax=Arenibaculum pallidiluteum TaxID=2812559 RepID=UPI001A967BF1|nr:ROK family transcriptional regulator [Arenibaculum pallidiluteum]
MRAIVNSSTIRALNVIRVFHALRANPGASQRDLVWLTGLDKATTSVVVAQLMADGLIVRGGRRREARVGRPESALSIAADAGLLIGARLEPGIIRILAATLAGTVVGRFQIPGSRDIGQALDHLRAGIEEAVAASAACGPLRGIGVGIPGLLDRTGRLVLAPNLGWRDTPIQPLLREVLGAPVFLDNDAVAAAIAEKLFGSCRDVDDYVCFTGHSGIGGGLYLGGRLYRGASGFAGEVGHITVVPDGRPCGCGKRGCLEGYASESAILAQAAERGHPQSDLQSLARAAEAGDSVLVGLLDEVGGHLGLAIAQAANILDPGLVVLGGNLSLVATLILPALEASLARNAMAPVAERVRIRLSPLGSDAVPMGGIALAMEGFLRAHTDMAHTLVQP